MASNDPQRNRAKAHRPEISLWYGTNVGLIEFQHGTKSASRCLKLPHRNSVSAASRTTASRRRLLDDQIPLVIHTQPRLPRLLQNRGMPVNLPCVGTTDDRHQERVGCVGETSETSVDTDRNVDHVSFIKIDRALLLAIQPENLPSTLYRDENFLPMRRQLRAQVSPLSGSVRPTYFAPFLGGDHRNLPPHAAPARD